MKEKEMLDLFTKKTARCRKLMVSKNGKYDSTEDTLATFKDEGVYMDEHPTQRCFSHMMKHITTLKSLVKKVSYTNTDLHDVDLEDLILIGQKATDDLINYCILFESLLKEKDEEENAE